MHEVVSTGHVAFTANEVFHVLAFTPVLSPVTIGILCPCFLRAMNSPLAQEAPPALLSHCRLVLRQSPDVILIGVWGSLSSGRPWRTRHCSDHLTRRKSHCCGVSFVKAGAVDMAKPGLKHEEDLLPVLVRYLLFWFTILIIPLYRQQRQYLKCLNVIIPQRLTGANSPAVPSAAHDAPWRLLSLLVVSEPLPHPAPSPETVTEAACPFMLKIVLSGKESVIYCQGNTDVFVMLSVVLGISGVCLSGKAVVSQKWPRFWTGLICSLLLLTSCSAPRRDQPALQFHVTLFWG